MESAIQYVTSADGTKIAYAVTGEGPPLLWIRGGAGQLDLDFEIPSLRKQIEWLSRRFTLVRADARGTGLSQRGAVEQSLERWVEDWQAIAGRLAIEQFALVSGGPMSGLAFTLAHRWPTRVMRLVLTTAITSANDLAALPGSAALQLQATDYEIYTELFGSLMYGWSSEEARIAARVHRASRTQSESLTMRPLAQSDVTHLLPEIRVPVLVWQPHDGVLSSMEIARRIVAALPDARLLVRSGNLLVMHWDEDPTVPEVERFLSWQQAAARDVPGGMAVILFADIVDSVGLTERLGDAAVHARTRDLDAALRAAMRAHAGTPLEGKLLGDGVLAVFQSARQAIAAGLECVRAARDCDLPLHVGLHAGDVIHERGDVHGGAVNIAARVAAASRPGEVVVSDVVRALGRTSSEVAFEDRGEQTLKGVREPIRLWAVRAETSGEASAR